MADFEKPYSEMVETLLYAYTLDSWLFKQLNLGSKEGDQAKVDTLGPYALVFGNVI